MEFELSQIVTHPVTNLSKRAQLRQSGRKTGETQLVTPSFERQCLSKYWVN